MIQLLQEKLARIKRTRLAKECAKLDPTFKKAIADEGLTEDLSQWPEYQGATFDGLNEIKGA
jgi:hypothetical protein